MSIDKYKAAQATTENPRQTEYRLFADVTKALISLKNSENKNGFKGPDFYKNVDWNRRLWLALQMDLAQEDNRFHDELKSNLISISLWVDKQTRAVMKGEASLDTLISINRTIMEGLLLNEENQKKNNTNSNKDNIHKLI